MSVNFSGYINLKAVCPYDIKYLYDLKIIKKINEHAKLFLTGIIPAEKKDIYIGSAKLQDKIEIFKTGSSSENKVLFSGITTDIEIKSQHGMYCIEIEALSHTYNLDIRLKKRSFQNKDMLYSSLVREVLSDYPGADFIDTASKGEKTEKFIIQYNETDWEFLKRMASRFNKGLVPDSVSGKPGFWFGTPESSVKADLSELFYSVLKKVGDYRLFSENYSSGASRKDFIYYLIETDRDLDVGDQVGFKGNNLFVYQKTALMKNGIMRYEYILTTENGLCRRPLLNDKAKGALVGGRVIDIKEDNIRLHLDIDKEQKKEEAYWFPYSTFYTAEGSTGWYCMPELGDNVNLYFPNGKEEEGVVVNSMRKGAKGADKINKPGIKYLRTRFNKELKFDREDLRITGKDDRVFINLNEVDGVEVYSEDEIKITAGENLLANADEIQITAGEEIDFVCKSSSIKMDGKTHIRGSLVKER